ncbi:MAG TPA: Ig-like domain-containing protein [Gemmatimonadales bacterium]
MSSVRLSVFLMAAAGLACGESITQPTVASVSIAPDSTTISVTETATFTASVLDASGLPVESVTLIWTSGDPTVFSVEGGVVTAIAPGSALLLANAGGLRDEARVVVTPGPASSLAIQPSATVLDPGATRKFKVEIEDAFGNDVSDAAIEWSTSNAAVITVDADSARITGVAPGTAWVRAAVGQVADSAQVDVVPFALNAIDAGAQFSCGVSNGYSVYCWGGNAFGVLGNGTTDGTSNAPQAVLGEVEFTGVSTGGTHVCGLERGGAVACWGRNHRGQLGDNTTATRSRPVFIRSDFSFKGVSVGDTHGCAITTGGIPYCWGGNDFAQTGQPLGASFPGAPPNVVPIPLRVESTPSFIGMSTGANHNCGLTTTGLAYCWGDGQAGQIGDGNTQGHVEPVPVAGGISFTTVSAGLTYNCALNAVGAAYCWGTGGAGQLGTGTSLELTPAAVNSGLVFTTITGGGTHTCGLTATGDAYCWGAGTFGQLGDGLSANSPTPVQVAGGLTFQRIRASHGGSHTCALTTGGVAYCWGRNDQGQLGDGTNGDAALPVRVSGQ